MGENLDKQIQAYITDLGKVGGGVNKALGVIIRKKDSGLLAENGGPVALTNEWAHYLLVHMGNVKGKPTVK